MTSTIQVLIPVLVGLAVSVQAQFMGQITRAAGTLESTFVTYGTGGLVITLIMILRGGGHIGQLPGLPWHVYLAGVLGLCIVGGISSSVARIGVVATFTTIVAAQLAAGALIDHGPHAECFPGCRNRDAAGRRMVDRAVDPSRPAPDWPPCGYTSVESNRMEGAE
jgi:transporter family-2 protein